MSNVRGQALTIRIVNAGKASFPECWPGYKTRASYDCQKWFKVETSYDVDKGELVFKLTSERVRAVAMLCTTPGLDSSIHSGRTSQCATSYLPFGRKLGFAGGACGTISSLNSAVAGRSTTPYWLISCVGCGLSPYLGVRLCRRGTKCLLGALLLLIASGP